MLLEALVKLGVLVVTTVEVDRAWLHLVRVGARVRARARVWGRAGVRVR